MDVVVTITEFKNLLKARGYTKNTIEGYRKNLDQFQRYLTGRRISDLREVTLQIIVDYQQQVMQQPVSPETKALKIRPVKRLFEHLTETHKLLLNPTEGIVESCRKHYRIGPVLSIEQMQQLLAQPNLSLRSHIRDRAIMELMYCTGIRLDELLKLQVYHIELKDKVLYIRKGKGGRQRVVPLGRQALKYLKEYLEKIRPHYAKKNPQSRTLFLTVQGLAITAPCVRGFLRRYRSAAGIKRAVSPHTFRRTCATHLLQQGANIRYVQKLLGHRHLSTTQKYTKLMPADLKKTHAQTHPNVGGHNEN